MPTHKSVRPLLLLSLFAALTLVLTACPTPAPPKADAGGEAELAADFELPDLNGNMVRLSDTHGKVRLLDFWATFCAPCIAEMPFHNELQEKYGDQGFMIIGIAGDEEGEAVVRPLVEKQNLVYLNLLDTDGTVADDYRVLGIPAYVLLDAEGKIVDRWMAAKPHDKLEQQIVDML